MTNDYSMTNDKCKVRYKYEINFQFTIFPPPADQPRAGNFQSMT